MVSVVEVPYLPVLQPMVEVPCWQVLQTMVEVAAELGLLALEELDSPDLLPLAAAWPDWQGLPPVAGVVAELASPVLPRVLASPVRVLAKQVLPQELLAVPAEIGWPVLPREV